MKIDTILLAGTVLILIAFILADRMLVATFEPTFKKLETQRIVTSNKLASAKIVYENLNHVRDLVQKNMIFPGQKDSVSHETIFFDFVTTCVRDLKMKLISCRPAIPQTAGTITTYGYDLELEGDFFTLGELCAKFENSRRIFSLVSYKVSLNDKEETRSGAPRNKAIKVTMRVNTFRVRKA